MGRYRAVNKELLRGKISDQQNEKAVYEVGENMCKLYISCRVHIQNIQEMHTTQKKKENAYNSKEKKKRNLILKWAKGQNTCMLLSCFTVLCFLFFRLSVCSKPASSRSIGTIFPTALHLFHLAALGLAVAHGVFSCSV